MAFLASIAITGLFHIPRNDALADVDAAGPDAAAAWAAYSGPWQRGNHVRTAAALGGALLLMVSLSDEGASGTGLDGQTSCLMGEVPPIQRQFHRPAGETDERCTRMARCESWWPPTSSPAP